MPEGADALFAEARSLEAEALRIGKDGRQGRELLTRSAELRREALGDKIYPVLTCKACLRVTGWTGRDGHCETCLHKAAFADRGGWLGLPDRREPPKQPARLPFRARAGALVGRRAALDRAIQTAWQRRVDPGMTGPIAPEVGFEVEVAQRSEVEAADGSGIVIRFWTATRRFTGSGWLQLWTTRIGRGGLLVPAEFSAGLPMEQLAEAWIDYKVAVEMVNRAAWRVQSEAREAERLAAEADRLNAEARAETLRRERHVADLLDEG